MEVYTKCFLNSKVFLITIHINIRYSVLVYQVILIYLEKFWLSGSFYQDLRNTFFVCKSTIFDVYGAFNNHTLQTQGKKIMKSFCN